MSSMLLNMTKSGAAARCPQVRETVQGEIEKVAKDSKSRGRGSRAAARLGAVAASAKYSRWGSAAARLAGTAQQAQPSLLAMHSGP